MSVDALVGVVISVNIVCMNCQLKHTQPMSDKLSTSQGKLAFHLSILAIMTVVDSCILSS